MKTIDFNLGDYTVLERSYLENDIEPAEYIRKDGSVLDMFLVKISRKDVDIFAPSMKWRYIAENVQRLGGWYDKERDGYMMRTQNSALAIAKRLLSIYK